MNINATLLGQTLVFIILIWFTVKFIWPVILKAVEERQIKIAEGLAFAEKADKSLAEAKANATVVLKDAHAQASKIIEQANRRSNELVEEARGTAIAEGQRLIGAAREQVELDSNRARAELSQQVAAIAVSGASKLLGREIDAKTHADLLDKLALEIERG